MRWSSPGIRGLARTLNSESGGSVSSFGTGAVRGIQIKIKIKIIKKEIKKEMGT